MRIYLFLPLFLTLFSEVVVAQQEILWLTDDNTDEKIKYFNNPIPSSTAEDTVGLLMRALPEYNLTMQFAQKPRMDRLLRKLPNVCVANRIKTPQRLKEQLFSLPINIYLNLHLYFKKYDGFQTLPAKILDKNNHLISLDKLFIANHKHLLGVDKARSFGFHLDKQIEKIDPHNLVVRSGGKSSHSLIHMLFKNRIDYLIDYPSEIKEALANFPEELNLGSVEIAASPDYIVGYVSCSKSELGIKIINDINMALIKIYKTKEFYQAHARYITKIDLPFFNRAFKKVFQHNNRL